ncbi:hypothetical protein MK137Hg11_000245400 [Dysgonomonas reticulitermitis]
MKTGLNREGKPLAKFDCQREGYPAICLCRSGCFATFGSGFLD